MSYGKWVETAGGAVGLQEEVARAADCCLHRRYGARCILVVSVLIMPPAFPPDLILWYRQHQRLHLRTETLRRSSAETGRRGYIWL